MDNHPKFKGTRGPWAVSYTDDNGQAVVKAEHTEVATCWHHCVGSIEKEMHANAQLIASAPTMFSFIRNFVEAWEDGMGGDSALYHEAKALIATATSSEA